ncbi:hypothetical protein ABL78_4642 [Leptomonas seymouri]|uniref:Uncharacterized protein n=1 Tax=Leptomonas seymouri TaxID=5684 RepID=A0A0N1IK26_LEPSE|nr:hypothetical protein ABL78_4642 [Leptomonas seymouri]|eukprot:KPI86295.1 hypothetical protein ABL78_4642 [Leptomonas seymouri]
MLNILLELLVSVALCGALVFFAFLNAPVEAGPGSEDDGAVNAATDAYEPAPLPSHELPLYTFLSKYISLGEDAPCGITYRWLLTHALHYTPREVYSERRLREYFSEVGISESEGENHSNRVYDAASYEESNSGTIEVGAQRYARDTPSPRSTPFPSTRVDGAPPPPLPRSRRRQRRSGPAVAAAPPTPLRCESMHWVNVALRWVAFLCLGSGTVKPEVWTDHLLYYTERVLNAVNAHHAEKMRARALRVRAVASTLTVGQQQQGGSLQEPFCAPQQRLLSMHLPPSVAEIPFSSTSPFSVPKVLVRVELLELGAGLLGGPVREVRRPQLSSGDAGLNRGGRRVTGGGRLDAAPPPGSLMTPRSATATPNGSAPCARIASPPAGVGAAPSAAAISNNTSTGGSAALNSPTLSSEHATPHNSAIAAAGVFLSNSMAGLSSALTDMVSSVAAANASSTNRSTGAGVGSNGEGGSGGLGGGGVTGEYANATGSGVGLVAAGTAAPLGVVLPRVEGDVISVELPYASEVIASSSASAAADVGAMSSTTASPKATSGSSYVPQTAAPVSLPLRCFAVPLLYEDQRFHLRLGCCLPLGALLPVELCVPPDVLTLDCAVAVRRIVFNGHLYAALHGACVELSFPVTPQFTAVVEVMPDYASGLCGIHGSSRSGAPHNHIGSGGQSLRSSAGNAVGTARTLGHTFTAVNTTRNEMKAVRDGGGVGGRAVSPPARPPLPPSSLPFTPRSSVYNFHSNADGLPSATRMTAAAATGTSSINEGNEKVQEVVLLAVQRLIQSLTYPSVLAGRLVCAPAGSEEDGGNGGAASRLSMQWQRTTASLPLRV